MRIALIDSYDSFTYNLAYGLRCHGAEVDVILNDAVGVEDLSVYDRLLLSPGPGLPSQAGIMPAAIKAYAPTKPILGVCLGHQAIAEAFGATLFNLPDVMHGVATDAYLAGHDALFAGLPDVFTVGRYHSWSVVPATMPACLLATVLDANGQILGLAHTEYNVRGLQFHPESVLTPLGMNILQNWLAL